MIAGVVLGLGALGGISGAALGGIGAAASTVEHRGEHGRHGWDAAPGQAPGDTADDHDGPVAPARPAPTG